MKKGSTGKKVGQLLISTLISDISQRGQQKKKPPFTQEEFREVEGGLQTDEDYTVYSVYSTLHGSIVENFNRGLAGNYQFYSGFTPLYAELAEAQNADSVPEMFDQCPIIMTESRYKELEAEAASKLRERQTSYYYVFFQVLDRFISKPEKAPEAIRAAIEKTKNTPAKRITLSNIYNKRIKAGYYTLSDGRRSDSLTAEEWKEARTKQALIEHGITAKQGESMKEAAERDSYKRFTKGCSLFFNGPKAIRAYVLDKTGKELEGTDKQITKDFSDALNAFRKNNFSRYRGKNAELIKEALGVFTVAKWRFYEELPEGLTAYDVLDVIPVAGIEENNSRQFLKAFREDYAELAGALDSYIRQNVPQARDLKANQLYKNIVTWGELADIGIISYDLATQPNARRIERMISDQEDSEEAGGALRGISILKDPTGEQVNESGEYIYPDSAAQPFRDILKLSANKNAVAELAAFRKEYIYKALRQLYSFNALMEIIGKVYDLPELAKTARHDTGILEGMANSFNNILYSFYYGVYGNEKEKQRKRAAIKKVFKPLEADAQRPSQEAINEIIEELTKLGFTKEAKQKLKRLDLLIDRLMNSAEEAN